MNAITLNRLGRSLSGLLAGLCLCGAVASAQDDDDKNNPNPKVTVGLTVPAALYVAPSAVTLTADAQARQKNHPIVRVEYYQGATLIGTARSAPYSFAWTNVPAGSYSVTAKATNDKGDSATSAPVAVAVDAPPTVALTAPTASQVLNAPATVNVSANAADSDGTVAKVEFYQGTTLIGTATTAPYNVTWTNVPSGNYTLTAKATDERGATTTSEPVQVIVNAPPTVALTAPTANQVVNAPGTITVTATAADSDGTVAKVEFYQGTTLIGSATATPYAFTWTNVPAGSYTLTGKATDDHGAATTSAPVTIIVNAPPTVAVAAPADAARIVGSKTIAVSVNASDSDGSIAKVEVYQGATLIGTATAAPYTFAWANVSPGSYTLTAKATDDRGATTTSSPVTLTVAANQAPTISLSTPTAGQKFTAPASIPLAVNAADVDGSIVKVTYFQNGNPIGTATAAPFGFTWTNVPQGTYSLTAQANDDLGMQTVSAPPDRDGECGGAGAGDVLHPSRSSRHASANYRQPAKHSLAVGQCGALWQHAGQRGSERYRHTIQLQPALPGAVLRQGNEPQLQLL